MNALATALVTSVLGTSRVFVVLLVGIASSRLPRNEPVLNKETCRAFSRACSHLFLPALMVSSTGATLNRAVLRDSWQLLAAASFSIGIAAAIAWSAGRVCFRRPEDRRAFRPVGLAVTFANTAGFPLLLMGALCEQDYVKSDFGDDAVECFTQATGMIFIYVVVWQAFFFGWGFFALGHDDTLERKLTGEPPKSQILRTPRERISSRSDPSSELPQQVENNSRPNGISDLGGERATAGGNGAEVIDVDESTTGNSGGISKGDRGGGKGWAELQQRGRRILLSPVIVAVTTGVVIAMIAPLQKMLFDNPRAVLRPLGAALQTVGQPEVAVSTLVMAGSLAHVPNAAVASTTARNYRILAGFLHVVCRLIVVPAVGFATFWVARTQSMVTGENRLMHFILLIEFAMPSAAFVIVSLNQLRLPATAGFMARMYLWQYVASMFTVAAWTALALHLVY